LFLDDRDAAVALGSASATIGGFGGFDGDGAMAVQDLDSLIHAVAVGDDGDDCTSAADFTFVVCGIVFGIEEAVEEASNAAAIFVLRAIVGQVDFVV